MPRKGIQLQIFFGKLDGLGEIGLEKRTDTENENFGTQLKMKIQNIEQCRFCGIANWSPTKKSPAIEANCNNCGKEGQYRKVYTQPKNNTRHARESIEKNNAPEQNQKVIRKYTLHKTKRKNRRDAKKNEKTKKSNVEINGKRKELVIDARSSVKLMPNDETVMGRKDNRKMRNNY